MKSSAAGETELLARLLALRDSPLDFARCVYPWGEEGTALEKIKSLAPWQVDELGALQDWLHAARKTKEAGGELADDVYKSAWSSGRGLYKSALLGILTHFHLSTHLGAMAIVAAHSENQLRVRIFPEFALWFGAAVNAHWFNVEGMKITPHNWLVEALRRSPAEGGLGLDPQFWGAFGQMWSAENPRGFAGGRSKYGTMVVFDEASTIWSPVWTVAEGFFAPEMDYKLWFAASQMHDNKGAFYDIFYDDKFAGRDPKRPGSGWRTRIMSAESMPDQAAWARGMIEKWGPDHDNVRVEVRGLPPLTSEAQFIPEGFVSLAQGNILFPDHGEALVFGVDPGPRGRTAIRARQGRNARDCLGRDTAIVLEGYDNVQIAEYVLQLDHRYKPLYWCIDFGLGTGVIDILKRRYMNGRLVVVKGGDMALDKKGEFGSRVSELWGKVRDWLPGGMIPKDDRESKYSLSRQLLDRGWKWSGREDGKKVLESKDDMKARGVPSPDDADALAYTFAVDPPRTDRKPGQGRGVMAIGVEESPYGF